MSDLWMHRVNCINIWINHKEERKRHRSSKTTNLHWVSWQNPPRPWAQHCEVGSSLSPEEHGFPQVAVEKKEFREIPDNICNLLSWKTSNSIPVKIWKIEDSPAAESQQCHWDLTKWLGCECDLTWPQTAAPTGIHQVLIILI